MDNEKNALLPDTHPMLRTRMEDFDFAIPPTDPVALAVLLWDEQQKHGAVGLASNQIGLPFRAFTMGLEERIVCFNPQVVEENGSEVGPEGCLSFPRLVLDVDRPFEIVGRYQDEHGDLFERSFEGLLARCFCHETDHLNGIVFTTKVSRLKLEQARKKARK